MLHAYALHTDISIKVLVVVYIVGLFYQKKSLVEFHGILAQATAGI